MKLCVLFLLMVVVGVSHCQSYTDQDRFGKTNEQVARMKHRDWVSWYCDASRGGEGQKVVAEKIYAVALYEDNQRRLKGRPEADRKFYDGVFVKLANLAKYALTINDACYPNRKNGPLTAAETGTAINRLISDMLSSKTPSERKAFKDVKRAFVKGNERIATISMDTGSSKYVQDHYPAMGRMIDQLELEFRNRGANDHQLMVHFCAYAIQVAVSAP
jgi:hypothetical protein